MNFVILFKIRNRSRLNPERLKQYRKEKMQFFTYDFAYVHIFK